MGNRKRRAVQRCALWAAIDAELGERVICERCGSKLKEYAERCTADLDERCPGFQAIEDAHQRQRTALVRIA